MHGLLQICALLTQAIVLARLHFKLLVDVLKLRLHHVFLGGEMLNLAISLLNYLLDAIDFHLSDVNLGLQLHQLCFGLLVDLFLS